MKCQLAYLFKVRKVNISGKQEKVYETKDIVCGFAFKNTDKNYIFHIITGKYAGEYAVCYDDKNLDEELVALIQNMEEAFEKNNNKVDFESMRKKILSQSAKYYIEGDSESLTSLKDEEIIAQLERENKNGFNENSFEKETDISNMYSSIRQTVISQDEQIMQILTSIFKNQFVANSELDIDLIAKLKENILIYGPTGTGKTEIIKRIAKLYDVPFVIVDATSLSETGYEGEKVKDMLKNLLAAADDDKEKAEKGILVIDEFDKLAENTKDGKSHVSRGGVQRALLKLLDGSKLYFEGKQFDTSRLTVICLGAFTDIIKGDNYQNITNEDFIKYGIMRELVGRFSKRIVMNALSKEDIKKILVESDFSPLKTYEKFFSLLNIEYSYENAFVDWIAEKAVELNTGARDLKIIVDNEISSALFKIFAGEYSSISLVAPESENDTPYILRKNKKED